MSTLISSDNSEDSLKIAAGYSKSANILMKYIGQTRSREVVHSMIVLRALALEIYLRCLYALERGKPYKGHNLKRIFDALSEKTRRKVTEYYDRSLLNSELIKQTTEMHKELKGNAPRLDLEHVLQEWSEALGEWRYLFEPKHKVVFLAFSEIEKAILQRLQDAAESKISSSHAEYRPAA